MRPCTWVAAVVVSVLAGCAQSAANQSVDDATAAPDADTAAPGDGEAPLADALRDACGGDGCGAGDVASDASDAGTDAAPAGTDAAIDAEAAADALDCAATMTALQAEITALATAHATCQHDADCTHVSTSTACQGTCGIGLNVNASSSFALSLEALNEKYCVATDYAAHCGYASPKCMAPNPGCVNNQCVYKK